MKHTYKQAKKAMNNLINYFGYRKSDFYDDGEDIICINYDKTQRKPTYFSRWMNLVNNFLLGICICRNNIVYL